ncbi:MAG: hypothetical protein ACRELB_22260 [Polyangiaceae bacterium]
MGLFERDPIVRVLEELTERMAAARVSLAEGDAGRALAAILEARRTLAGPLAATAERMDGATVVSLLGKDRARAYADVTRLEAEARRALGEDGAAARADARATEIERALG